MKLNLNNKHDENNIGINIIRKLRGLGINGITLGDEIPGPVVTGFPLRIPASIPIKSILSKEEDIALACNVESVVIRRIGNEVIVFIPNKNRTDINFLDALFWYLKDEHVREMQLPILLGTNYRGEKAVLELTTCPHILIAGSTGSGKSIFESNIISALSMLKKENEIYFYLVDTKRLDLTLFENLSHVKQIVRSLDEWYETINDILAIVDRRNTQIELAKVRNISEYNKLYPNAKLPYIILLIDELADLMDRDKERKKIEGKEYGKTPVDLSLARLIQICRASGVHIIACTQRTSVNVINGTIKANFPTRISLRLPTRIDSQTILGENGAENLLGKGDMLIKKNDSDSLERFHSPFVRLEDIEQILNQRDRILESIQCTS